MSMSAIPPMNHTTTTNPMASREVPGPADDSLLLAADLWSAKRVVNFRILSQELRVWERRLQDVFRSKLGEEAGDEFFFYLIYNLMGDEYPENNIELLQTLFDRNHIELLTAIGNWVITMKQVIFGTTLLGDRRSQESSRESSEVLEGPSPRPVPETPYAFWLMIEPYITEHWAGKFSHALPYEEKEMMQTEFRSEWIRTMRLAYLAQTREEQEAILADFQLLHEISASYPIMPSAEVARAAYPVVHRLFMPMLKLGFDWSVEAKVFLDDPADDYDDDSFDCHHDFD